MEEQLEDETVCVSQDGGSDVAPGRLCVPGRSLSAAVVVLNDAVRNRGGQRRCHHTCDCACVHTGPGPVSAGQLHMMAVLDMQRVDGGPVCCGWTAGGSSAGLCGGVCGLKSSLGPPRKVSCF